MSCWCPSSILVCGVWWAQFVCKKVGFFLRVAGVFFVPHSRNRAGQGAWRAALGCVFAAACHACHYVVGGMPPEVWLRMVHSSQARLSHHLFWLAPRPRLCVHLAPLANRQSFSPSPAYLILPHPLPT